MAAEETELAFIRCPGCRSLVPSVATRCRMCGEPLQAKKESAAAAPSSEGGENTRRMRIRQRTVNAMVGEAEVPFPGAEAESAEPPPPPKPATEEFRPALSQGEYSRVVEEYREEPEEAGYYSDDQVDEDDQLNTADYPQNDEVNDPEYSPPVEQFVYQESRGQGWSDPGSEPHHSSSRPSSEPRNERGWEAESEAPREPSREPRETREPTRGGLRQPFRVASEPRRDAPVAGREFRGQRVSARTENPQAEVQRGEVRRVGTTPPDHRQNDLFDRESLAEEAPSTDTLQTNSGQTNSGQTNSGQTNSGQTNSAHPGRIRFEAAARTQSSHHSSHRDDEAPSQSGRGERESRESKPLPSQSRPVVTTRREAYEGHETREESRRQDPPPRAASPRPIESRPRPIPPEMFRGDVPTEESYQEPSHRAQRREDSPVISQPQGSYQSGLVNDQEPVEDGDYYDDEESGVLEVNEVARNQDQDPERKKKRRRRRKKKKAVEALAPAELSGVQPEAPHLSMQHDTVQRDTVQRDTVRHDTVHHDTVQYNSGKFNTARQSSAMQHSTIAPNGAVPSGVTQRSDSLSTLAPMSTSLSNVPRQEQLPQAQLHHDSREQRGAHHTAPQQPPVVHQHATYQEGASSYGSEVHQYDAHTTPSTRLSSGESGFHVNKNEQREVMNQVVETQMGVPFHQEPSHQHPSHQHPSHQQPSNQPMTKPQPSEPAYRPEPSHESELRINESRNTDPEIELPGGLLMGWFVVYDQSGKGAARDIQSGRFFVGGAQLRESDFVVVHPSVSTPHCLVHSIPGEGIKVLDLMSERGTYVKRRGTNAYVRQAEQVTLSHGDWLKFGNYEVLICLIPT